MRISIRLLFIGLSLCGTLLSGCALFTDVPAATPTPSVTLPPTETYTATATLTASPSPTVTFTPSATLTPSITLTPSHTPTITTTPYPTVLPQPLPTIAGQPSTIEDIDKAIKGTIGKGLISFVNIADKPSTTIPGTPTAAAEIETVYLADPETGGRIKVVDLSSSVGARIYWSPNGAYMAYFLENSFLTGLYVLDLTSGLNTRILAIANENPHSILSEPIWSPDSKQLTITLGTAFGTNIFTMAPDGSAFHDLSTSGAFDFYPAWSPDGQYLAFVSDRKLCPSYEPNAPGSCYKPADPNAPESETAHGGYLYVIDTTVSDAQPQLKAEKWITTQPHWITRDNLAFTSSPQDNPTAGSTLWYVDLRSGALHSVTDENPNGTLILDDAWSNDGSRVVYQEAQSITHIVMRDSGGKELARSIDDLNFPRYAFSAAWSPDGKKLALGGSSGQCPYGMIVTDDQFKSLVTANPNPGVCDPAWSPDGRWIAFAGITHSGSGTDGSYDAYVAESSGYGARPLTAKLGGQIRLLGWVGGHP